MNKMSKEQFLEAVKRNPKLLLYPQKQYACNNHIEDVYLFDYCKESFTFQELEELRNKHFNANWNPSGKMSYASHPDIVPHKTGVPKEWLDKALNIEMIEQCINEHHTIIQNTISEDEFLNTIRLYYLDGIIPYEDLKYIKCLTEEDIEYITRQPQGTLSIPIPPALINMYGIEEAYRRHQKSLYRRK